MPNTYFVYIMASHTRVLYIGMTSRLHERVYDHRTGAHRGFTGRQKVSKLVYFEASANPGAAFLRERHIKGWSRKKRMTLVEMWNPHWVDLAADWFEERGVTTRPTSPAQRRA